MRFEKQLRTTPYWKKQEDYDRERIAVPEYPHLHRHNYPRAKKRFKREERHVSQAIVSLALQQGNMEEVSNNLLQTVSVRLKGPKHGATSLREIVRWTLDQRVKTHGARKQRHCLPFTPRSQPKSKTKTLKVQSKNSCFALLLYRVLDTSQLSEFRFFNGELCARISIAPASVRRAAYCRSRASTYCSAGRAASLCATTKIP